MSTELSFAHVSSPRTSALDWLIAAALALASLAVFWPALSAPFLTYDDGEYVTAQSMVNQGVRSAALRWMWTQPHAANWHPLTTFAHMSTCQLFELDPRGHHAVNLLVHALNAALCFAAFRRLTGQRWSSAFVAAVFALHPLRVESVAWVAELKDLLCGLFWFLALLAYARYGERRTRGRYALVVCATIGALLAKPMAVTLPATLLLLDYWPLRRWPAESWRALVWEKKWLFLIVAAHSVVVLAVQFGSGAATFAMRVPFTARAGNALVSYARYLGSFFWPVDLAVLYPHPIWWPWASILASVLALGAISWLAWRGRRSAPWMLVGWLWFLGTLVPVIGLIQVGVQAMADRYTYIPALGIAVAITWTLGPVLATVPRGRWVGVIGAIVVLAALMVATRVALVPWRGSVALFEHAMRVNSRPSLIRNWLAIALVEAGRHAEAAEQLRALIREDPDFLNGYVVLSSILAGQQRHEEAIAVLRQGAARGPGNAQLWNNLGLRLLAKGATREAGEAFEQAARLSDEGSIDTNLAVLYTRAGRVEQAELSLRNAIRKNPWDAGNYNDLAVNLGQRGAWAEARELLEKGLWINPRNVNLLLNYAALLERQGDKAGAEKSRAEAARWAGAR